MSASGSAGALIAYGSRAIPFVAGAYGYNAMEDKAIEVNRQAMTMLQATGGDESRSRDLIAGLEKTASSLSMKVSDVFPAFTQLYSGARSIGIEKTIPQGYENFLKYATVSGADTENIKSASRALFQIMSKGQFMAEEVKGQMAEHNLPGVIQALADVAAGGSTKDLADKMKKGEVDAKTYMPLFLARLGELAKPGMEKFEGSLVQASGNVGLKFDLLSRKVRRSIS